LLHNKKAKAIAIFERIAKSNNKDISKCECLQKLIQAENELIESNDEASKDAEQVHKVS